MQQPVEIMDTEPTKRSFFLKKVSNENVKPPHSLKESRLNLFQRPMSALARHRVHELSDIREASGSSKQDSTLRRPSGLFDGSKDPAPETPPRREKAESKSPSSGYARPTTRENGPATSPKGLGSRAASAMSLPLRDVPERRSSASILGQSVAGSRQGSIHDFPSWKLPPASAAGQSIPPRGRAESPVRRALRRDAVSSDLVRPSPSCTFIRTAPPLDILDNGCSRHARLDLTVKLPSPLFVGGGTVEGQLSLEVDGGGARKNKLKPMLISKLSIDIIGVEEVSDGRRWIFLSLATELFDENHPPPPSLVFSQAPTGGSELFWELKPSSAAIPFCLNLPLNLGPPPYLSKQAGIRYLLCPTAVIKIGSKKSTIRQTWNIQMLTVHDPEKALASLPSPLLASDTLLVSPCEGEKAQSVRLTAGLHRQTWVNGATIFIDIHIANNSAKLVKKVELQLEKSTLWYAHAAAGTAEKSASHLRLPKKNDKEIISNTIIKHSREWAGVLPHTSEVRTCELNVPRGHVTISTGRYFEVRYFLNVIITVSRFKTVAVQLPITIIHMNSLDILPNSLAQVAASIEAKRARTVPVTQDTPLYPLYHQGQAFTAARRQSLDRMRNERGCLMHDDISALTSDIDSSPRRYPNYQNHNHGRNTILSTHMIDENFAPSRPSGAPSSHRHQIRHPSCSHCHLLFNLDHSRKNSSLPPGPRLPRLQLSTSGLGFSDSEFEVAADSPPRKVMLSETERKMINQQRELKIQRQWSQKSRRKTIDGDTDKEKVEGPQDGYWGWKNVAAAPNAGPKSPDFGNRSVGGVTRQPSQRKERLTARESVPARSRSKTNPERPGLMPGRVMHRRGPRSIDRTSRMAFVIEGTRPEMMPSRRSRDAGFGPSGQLQQRW